jgi:hypothetical protein
VTVPHQASQYPRESWVTTYQPCCTSALESKHTRLRKAAWGKDVGPTRGFTASPRVGPGATVGTLRTGYPRVQVSSQENNSHLLAGGSSEAATCPPPTALAPASRLEAAQGPPCATVAPAPTLWLRAAPELPHVLRTGSAGSKQLNKYPLTTWPS